MADIDSDLSAVLYSGTRLAVPDNEISVYFAEAGETWAEFNGNYTASGWTDEQMASALGALDQISNSVDLTFSAIDNPTDATFFLGTRSFADTAVTGYFYLPESPNSGTGAFNTTAPTWTADDAFEPGAFNYFLFLHEFGHGLGLEHPHSDFANVEGFPGVFNYYDLGDYDLNQSIYTVMTYNEGYVIHPSGPLHWTENYGHAASLMALDIAVLQDIYGANTTYASGNDIYELDGSNGVGTFYSAIWDTGGFDTIANNTANASIIDLRPATLQVEQGGGGYLSFVDGVYGGFTVANGVVIEQAVGGSNTDIITGNAADNILIGNGGNDVL
ncbi:MAG: M10 family metallopeptidase, partial [Planktomarina sp.]